MAVGYKPIKGHKRFSIVGTVLTLLPIVLAYLAWAFVPVWWNDLSVKEALHKWANSAYRKRDVQVIRKGIEGSLAKLGIEIDPDQLDVRFELPDKDYIYIDLEYDVDVTLPFTSKVVPTHWEHHVETDLSTIVW